MERVLRKPDGKQAHLTLIWGRSVSRSSEKKRKQVDQTSGSETQGRSLRDWVNDNDGFLTIIGLVAGACFFAGGFYSSWYMRENLEKELKEYVDSSLNPIRVSVGRMEGEIVKLQTGLANLQGRLGGIAGIVYKERAAALGFTDAQISFVELVKSSEVRVALSNQGWSYDFTLTLTDVKKDSLGFLVNGAINRTIVLHYVTVTIPRQTGVPLDLMEVIGNAVKTVPPPPPVWAVILDYPGSNTAVFAVGLRDTKTS